MNQPILIGICGGSGSGKTRFTKLLCDELGNSVVISVDNYYKDQSHLSAREVEDHNFDHPDAIDFDLLHEDLSKAKRGELISVPNYDFEYHRRLESKIEIDPRHYILVEGILLLVNPELRELIDCTIYVDADDDIRLLRRIRRDIIERGRSLESILDQYELTVKPMHNEHVVGQRNIVDRVVHSRVPADLEDQLPSIIEQLKEMLCRA